MAVLEYIWLDGGKEKNIRSKVKIEQDRSKLSDWVNKDWDKGFPWWGFDGSSTEQAPGNNSDCLLKPVSVVFNPLRTAETCMYKNVYTEQSFIVLCEVMNADGTPHETNSRAKMLETYAKYEKHKMWFAFEQEYTLYDRYGEHPYLWRSGYPAPQGRYYCGVGADVAWGREISDEHLEACIKAGLSIVGTNAEVMPSQWEFQTGPDIAPASADNLWISRFILNRVAAKYGSTIKLDPKPKEGDWNGAGCHTNFSTQRMRTDCPTAHQKAICEAIRDRVKEHISVYGHKNDERLTGLHETQHIDEFTYGVSDRGASIRIPPAMDKNGAGYLEDRRPAANIDPYEVCDVLLEAVCGAYDRGEIDQPVKKAEYATV